MRLLLLFWIACFAAQLSAQDAPGVAVEKSRVASPQPSLVSPPQTRIVQLTECRIRALVEPKFTASDILQKFEQMQKDRSLDVLEVIRMSALDGHESMVQFGKRASVTTGVSPVPGRGVARQVQERMVGTMVRATTEQKDGQILLKLNYEASRLGEVKEDDTPPDTQTLQINTTLLLDKGKPTLVGGTSAEASTYLIVTVANP